MMQVPHVSRPLILRHINLANVAGDLQFYLKHLRRKSPHSVCK